MTSPLANAEERLALLILDADSHMAVRDWAGAEVSLIRAQTLIAAIPNMSRSDATIEYTNRIDAALATVRRKMAAKQSKTVLKTEWTRPEPDCY